jgi:hypothetical protein
VAGLCLCCVVVVVCCRLRPHHSPKLYLVFLVVVHAVVEAGIAFTLLYTTWISPPWLVALCNCGGSQAAAAAGAGRRDDVSTPGSPYVLGPTMPLASPPPRPLW